MDALAVAIRFLLGGIFLVGGVAKLRRGEDFVAAVRAYRLLPQVLMRPVGRALPVVEAGLGVLLLLGVLVDLAAWSAAGLLTILAGAIGLNLLRGRRIDCGCIGIAEHAKISWSLVVRNLVLATSGVVLATGPPTGLSVEASEQSALSSGEAWTFGLYSLLSLGVLMVAMKGLRVTRSASRLGRPA